MTARLRELAERWKAGDFEERECAEQLLAILDAEGDGWAVAWMTRHDEPMLFLSREEAATYCDDDEDPISLYTHPARSGGVSDADVERGLEMMFGVTGKDADVYRPGMRAALTHFAKGERHE